MGTESLGEGDGNLVLVDSDLEDAQVRVGQSDEDEIAADPRTGELFFLKKFLIKAHKAHKGNVKSKNKKSKHKTHGSRGFELNLATDDDEAPEILVLVDGDGNVVHVDSDLEDTQIRIGQSDEGEIVVDPRTGQLVLIKTALHKGKKVVKKLGPLVAGAGLLGAGALLEDLKDRVGLNAGDEIGVDPRSGQLFLIKTALLGKKALHKGKKVVKKLGPLVAGAGLLGAGALGAGALGA